MPSSRHFNVAIQRNMQDIRTFASCGEAVAKPPRGPAQVQ
jgi:hypothetical protein